MWVGPGRALPGPWGVGGSRLRPSVRVWPGRAPPRGCWGSLARVGLSGVLSPGWPSCAWAALVVLVGSGPDVGCCRLSSSAIVCSRLSCAFCSALEVIYPSVPRHGASMARFCSVWVALPFCSRLGGCQPDSDSAVFLLNFVLCLLAGPVPLLAVYVSCCGVSSGSSRLFGLGFAG